MSLDAQRLNIILPVGISFYTFQTLSYSIDIYRRKLEPTKDIIAFFAFVSFFPQLVAGPIERATNLLPQFFKDRRFDYNQASLRGALSQPYLTYTVCTCTPVFDADLVCSQAGGPRATFLISVSLNVFCVFRFFVFWWEFLVWKTKHY